MKELFVVSMMGGVIALLCARGWDKSDAILFVGILFIVGILVRIEDHIQKWTWEEEDYEISDPLQRR